MEGNAIFFDIKNGLAPNRLTPTLEKPHDLQATQLVSPTFGSIHERRTSGTHEARHGLGRGCLTD
jgi:hypothetical protein